MRFLSVFSVFCAGISALAIREEAVRDGASLTLDKRVLAVTAVNALATPAVQPVGPKLVFAHYMMGNTYSFAVPDFSAAIKEAQSYGVDGFALNVGPDAWMPAQTDKMYQAALGTTFKLFISLDMAVMHSAPISSLTPWVTTYAKHPNQYWYKKKQFLSTFAGEDMTFGQASVDAGWSLFKNTLAGRGYPIYFMPAFTALGPTKAMSLKAVDGCFSWNAWPNTNAAMTTAEDTAYMSARQPGTKSYMAGVSPWFYSHFSYKNFDYRSEDLFTTRWDEMIALQPDFLELITWNDFGESSYIGSVAGITPYDANINSIEWVRGRDHTAWADLGKYYISAYKAGRYPAITTNKVYWWYRGHSRDAVASADPYGKPANYLYLKDNIYITVLLNTIATITVTNAGGQQVFAGSPGINYFQYLGFVEGSVTVNVKYTDTLGQTVIKDLPSSLVISNTITTYNYNPAVFMASL